MKNKLTPPYITDLNIVSINDAIMDLYRNLNIIKDSADELTFEEGHKGEKKLLAKTKNGTIDLNNEEKQKLKVRDLHLSGDIWGVKHPLSGALPRLIKLPDNVDTVIGGSISTGIKFTSTDSIIIQSPVAGIFNNTGETEPTRWTITNSGDTKVLFFAGATAGWRVGNDYKNASGTIINSFKIEKGGGIASNFSDKAQLELDTGHASDWDDTTLSITGGENSNASLNLESDSSADGNGDNWKISSTHTLHNFQISNDISGSQVAQFGITPNATVANGVATFVTQLKVNTETAASSETGKIAVLDSGIFKYRTPAQLAEEMGTNLRYMTHNFDYSGTGATYIPFAGSQTEGHIISSDGTFDESVFIVPTGGTLEKLIFQSVSAAGGTNALLRVNGTDGSYADSSVACGSAETTYTIVIKDTSNSFAAGDRLRIKFDPGTAPDEVAMTSVWKFNKT